MMKLIVVGIGGFLGAIARYSLSMLAGIHWKSDFPMGTFIINITGSFILAFFMSLILNKFEINPLWRLFFAVGFLGAYTTFSTLEYETFNLLNDGQYWLAFLNIVGSSTIGLVAVWFGNFLSKMI